MSRVKLANAILDRALSGIGLMRSSAGVDLTNKLLNARSNATRNKVLGLLGTGGAAGAGAYNSLLHADAIAKLNGRQVNELATLANKNKSLEGLLAGYKDNVAQLGSKLDSAKSSLKQYSDSTFGTNDTDVLHELSKILN